MKHEYIGPWFVDDTVARASIGYRAIITLDGDTICNPSPMGESNARLIAAAPVLLDALKRAEIALEGYSGDEASELANIRAAIRCATGDA